MALPIVPKGAADTASSSFGSPVERLRRRREALAAGSTKLFVLPGYDESNGALGGELVARYRRMTVEELGEVFKRDRWTGTDGKVDSVAANAQFLIDACDELLFRDTAAGSTSLEPLVPGHKTTFTVDLTTHVGLGSILGVDGLPSMRAQMVAMFGDNEFALNDHSAAVHQWMVSANMADEDASPGES